MTFLNFLMSLCKYPESCPVFLSGQNTIQESEKRGFSLIARTKSIKRLETSSEAKNKKKLDLKKTYFEQGVYPSQQSKKKLN